MIHIARILHSTIIHCNWYTIFLGDHPSIYIYIHIFDDIPFNKPSIETSGRILLKIPWWSGCKRRPDTLLSCGKRGFWTIQRWGFWWGIRMKLDGYGWILMVYSTKNMGISSQWCYSYGQRQNQPQNCRGKSNCDNVILEFRKYDGCLISFSR